jgi:excisionase family DNA binding protein
MNNEDDLLPHLPGYISVRQAANLLGVAERTVYGYIDDGKLPAVRVGNAIALEEQIVKDFDRQATGRPRTRVPAWRLPVGKNIQYLTVIFASVRPGQGNKLDQKLEEMRAGDKHLLPGTVARYIARNEEKPDDVQIVLVWRSTVMPPKEERDAALASLREELAEILDWDTAWSESGRVLMHT